MNSPEPKHQHLQCLAHRRTQVDDECRFLVNLNYLQINNIKISQLRMLDDQSQYCTSETIHNHESISGENGPKHHIESADVGTVSAP